MDNSSMVKLFSSCSIRLVRPLSRLDRQGASHAGKIAGALRPCPGFALVASLLVGVCCISPRLLAQQTDAQVQQTDSQTQETDSTETETPEQAEARRFEAFESLMTGATLNGNFTVIGQDNALKPEKYVIESAKKYKEGDYWIFKVRITYGQRDETLTFPIQVKWADDTPVITLEKGEIPVLKDYGARVVIDDGKYAGTWSAPQGGGHLFGVIERSDAAEDDGAEDDGADKDDGAPASR